MWLLKNVWNFKKSATTLHISVDRHDSESHAVSLPNVISNNWSPDLAVILTKNDREATLITEQIHNGKLSLMKTLKTRCPCIFRG